MSKIDSSKKHVSSSISFGTALLTNLNMMIGVGIFVNTATLVRDAGALSPLSYLIVGLIMLPLILAINKLMIRHKGGNFYTFGAENINSAWGFISCWSYFIGKLASCSLMVHFFSSLIQQLIPKLSIYPTLILDIIVLSLLTALNCLNTKIGSRIQFLIFLIKISPIILIIFGGIWLADFTEWDYSATKINNLVPTIPLIVYAFTGFEATCSLAACLKNPEKNGPRAILAAFGIVMAITICYQFWSFVIANQSLASASNFADAFSIIGKKIDPIFSDKLNCSYLLQFAAAISAFGAAYGVFYSNNRNLYTLAQHGHIFFSRYFMHLNKNCIPWLAVVAQSIICALYLLISKDNNVPLQQISSIGCTTAYLISCLGLIMHGLRRNFIGILGLLSSGILLIFSIYSALSNSSLAFIVFYALVLFGILMYRKA
jgi:amino acid transporter